MSRYQRTALVSFACIALLVGVAGRAIGLPVQGNLAITSGFGGVGVGVLGEVIDVGVAGPGFSLRFRACAETTCNHIPEGGPTSSTRTVPPSTVFSPTIFSPGPFSNLFFDSASATILGVLYRHNAEMFLPGFNHILSESPLRFDATFVTPPAGAPGQQTTLSAPFTFATDILITDTFFGQFQPLLDLHLSGQGMATANLLSSFCSEGPGCNTWFLSNTSYVFTPSAVPEPASILLLATTAGGISLASWRRWRASEKQHAA